MAEEKGFEPAENEIQEEELAQPAQKAPLLVKILLYFPIFIVIVIITIAASAFAKMYVQDDTLSSQLDVSSLIVIKET